MNLEENKNGFEGTLRDSGLLIAFITGISYATTYVYQHSFLHYYGIPSYFAEIRLSQVLFTALIVILVFLVFTFVFISAINDIKQNNKIILKDEIRFFLKLFLPFFFIFTVSFYIIIHRVMISLIVSFIFSFIYVLILRRIVLSKKKDESNNKSSFLLPFIKILGGYKILFFITIFIFFLFIASSTGKIIAGTRSEYLIINTTPVTAVIEAYSGGFITIEINKEKKTFDENIHFINNDQIFLDKLVFNREHVGPLRNGGVYISNDFISEYLVTHFKFLSFLKKY